MLLPAPRGPVSSSIREAIHRQEPSLLAPPNEACTVDPVSDEDLQLALWMCYELHYHGFNDCDPTWEWQPELIGTRRTLEAQLLRALRRDVSFPKTDQPVATRLRHLVEADDGPS